MFQLSRFRTVLFSLTTVALAVACSAEPARVERPSGAPALEWAIAIHGGAGSLGRDAPDSVRDRYLE
ncbi:MAG: hypothetical protein IH848_07790, partial [Acidobacteria bacterium]|nr:hypothetical protein [Acidobacteriota bacterium]